MHIHVKMPHFHLQMYNTHRTHSHNQVASLPSTTTLLVPKFPNTHHDPAYLSYIFSLQFLARISFSKIHSNVFTQPRHPTQVIFFFFCINCMFHDSYSPYACTTCSMYLIIYNNDATMLMNFLDSYVLTTSKPHILSLPEAFHVSILLFSTTMTQRPSWLLWTRTYSPHQNHIYPHFWNPSLFLCFSSYSEPTTMTQFS